MSQDDMPWISAYQEHAWKVHSFPLEATAHFPPSESTSDEYRVCAAESSWAQTAWRWRDRNPVQVFYYDLEQMAAGLDDVYGSQGGVRILREEWNGHPQGALVYEVFMEPGQATFMVEVC